MMKPCTTCHRPLLPHQFASAGKGLRKAICCPCANDDHRLRRPLPEIRRDPVQVQLNNAACLWFYPAQPTNLLRYSP